jgi:hypothetical protein
MCKIKLISIILGLTVIVMAKHKDPVKKKAVKHYSFKSVPDWSVTKKGNQLKYLNHLYNTK